MHMSLSASTFRSTSLLFAVKLKAAFNLSASFKSGSEVIKLFPCSNQLSMKFKMLISIKIDRINGILRFKLSKPVIYPANKCNQRTNGPVNAHLIFWPSKAQNIQNLENIW